MTDYATTDDLKTFLRIDQTNTDDDTLLGLAITAASRAIDTATNRTFDVSGVSATARYFTARRQQYGRHETLFSSYWYTGYGPAMYYVVDIDDLSTSSGLSIDVDTANDLTYSTNIASSNYDLVPATGDKPFNKIVFHTTITVPLSYNAVRVTAKWGWSALPDTIKYATLIQASRLFKRRDAPFGIAGSPDLGSELRLLAKLDPDVEQLLAGYRKSWGAF